MVRGTTRAVCDAGDRQSRRRSVACDQPRPATLDRLSHLINSASRHCLRKARQAIFLFMHQGEYMDSEVIVVLVLIAFAVGFIIWVRKHSQAHDAQTPGGQPNQESQPTKKY